MLLPEPYALHLNTRQIDITLRLQEFRAVPRLHWFYELCFCLCTPQSKALHAARVVDILRKEDFRNNDCNLCAILGNPANYIRFHNTKAQRIQAMKSLFGDIERLIDESKDDAFRLRDLLRSTVKGLGMKEAAHFLRNIGIYGPAILDRHTLYHLKELKVIEETQVRSDKHYREIEVKWLEYCKEVGVPIEVMDLLFWSMQTGFVFK